VATIFQAPPYEPRRERRKKLIIIGAAAVLVVVASLAYAYRNWPYERVVERFFTALKAQDYLKAYGIWMVDPNWKQHPERYNRYSYADFYRDWGPGGEYGIVRNFEIEGSANPGGSGVVVVVRVNDRAERANIWVEKKDKSLSFSPYQTVR